MIKTLTIYSTVGGNTELVVKKVRSLLLEKNIANQIQRVDTTLPEEILKYDLVIIASPTYNQGTLEDHFKPFIKAWKSVDTSGKCFAAIGLGTPKFYPEYLTEATSIIEDLIRKNNGTVLIPGLRIGANPLKFIDTLVPRWVDKVVEAIKISS
jgi:flavodoxin